MLRIRSVTSFLGFPLLLALPFAACTIAACTSNLGAGEAGSGVSGTGAAPSTGGGSGGLTVAPGECDVAALFQDKCSECHGSPPLFGELDLVSDGLAERLVDVTAVACIEWPLVVAGDPERSLLYQKVASETPPCGERMPAEAPLSTAEIACVAEYIRLLGDGTEPVPCETCGGTLCIDVMTDADHCGGCDQPCAAEQVCEEGSCVGCGEGLMACDGACVDVLADDANCGECGKTCGGGQTCHAGVCECDAGASVSFAADVAPLLDMRCASAGCHASSGGKPANAGPADSKSSLVLTATEAYAQLVDQPSGCDSLDLVEPGEVGASYLMNKLLGVDMCGGTRMPKGKAPLSEAEMDVIGAWICAGALDD